MKGMNAGEGSSIENLSHVFQSVNQILTTPLGSRLMRRDFGSLLPELVDQPLHNMTIVQIYAATATALALHEPRFKMRQAQLVADPGRPGKALLDIAGRLLMDGFSGDVSLSVPLSGRAGVA